MAEVRYVGGAVLWPGDDLAAQRRIVLGQRLAALEAIGHGDGCVCDLCRPHRRRIAELMRQLGEAN